MTADQLKHGQVIRIPDLGIAFTITVEMSEGSDTQTWQYNCGAGRVIQGKMIPAPPPSPRVQLDLLKTFVASMEKRIDEAESKQIADALVPDGTVESGDRSAGDAGGQVPDGETGQDRSEPDNGVPEPVRDTVEAGTNPLRGITFDSDDDGS